VGWESYVQPTLGKRSDIMIKVFLSDQSADSMTAAQVARRLKVNHDIDSYLYVIAPYIGRRAADLAAHIRAQKGRCTQLLTVISASTQASQWVPWKSAWRRKRIIPWQRTRPAPASLPSA
jgi:hypothetical protein